MRFMKLAMLALVAVFAVGAMTAATASAAAGPLFLTESAKELSFTASGGVATLRGLNLGAVGTITCEKNTSKGFITPKSTLAHRVVVEFSGKCEQTVGTNKGTCTEPIKTAEMLAELGLVSKKVVELLAPSSGTTFVTVTCTNGNTTVEGAVVGEFPEVNAKGVNQYNKMLTESELVFEAEGKNTDNQAIKTIELLGTNMTGAELKVSGFFGGKASQEGTGIIKPDGGVEICTKSTC